MVAAALVVVTAALLVLSGGDSSSSCFEVDMSATLAGVEAAAPVDAG